MFMVQLTNLVSWWFDGLTCQVLMTTLTATLIIWFILTTQRQTNGKRRPLLGPCGLPLVGYLPFIGVDLRRTFKILAQIYGPIFKVRLGTKDCIFITSPSHAKEVLRNQDLNFANRNPTVAITLGGFGGSDIAFSDYGPEWRKMKKNFVSEMLSSSNFDASYSLRKNIVKKMISKTYTKVGELVDIGELTFCAVFSLIMSMVWGDALTEKHGDVMNSEFRAVITDYMFYLGKPNISDFLPYLAWFDLQGVRRKMKVVTDRVEKLFDLAIEHHNAVENVSHKDFLGYLLQLTKLTDPASSLSLNQVKGFLMDAIVGGTDTRALTIEWAMAEMLKHPNTLKTAQEELAETIGLNNTVEESHLPKLNYLNAILKETLRLHPPVALLMPHCSTTATTIGGYSVPNNAITFLNTWAIHRDPKIWEDPLDFRTERFLNGSENLDFLGNNVKYLPFSSGRRMCPGMPLAEKMSMFVLASLLHHFEWALPYGTEDVDMSEIFGLTVKKLKPTLAFPRPRLSRIELYTDE